MTEQHDGGEMPQATFAAHVYTIGMQALIFLGKEVHPETKKYERNLDVAKFQIDTLDVLKTKTEGNLDEEESNLLEALLHRCRMAYVDETKEG